jgi:hypothetical protein
MTGGPEGAIDRLRLPFRVPLTQQGFADEDCITDLIVYRQTDRRRGITLAPYALIKADIGRSLVPSRIRSKAGRTFWASRAAR